MYTAIKHSHDQLQTINITSKQYSIGAPAIAFFFGPSSGRVAAAASAMPTRGILVDDICNFFCPLQILDDKIERSLKIGQWPVNAPFVHEHKAATSANNVNGEMMGAFWIPGQTSESWQSIVLVALPGCEHIV
jgi:hypothetical protein